MASLYEYTVTLFSILSLLVYANGYTPETFFLEKNCDTPIAFSKSMILAVSNLTTVQTCNVIAQANTINNRLLIDFTDFDLVDNCTDTNIHIVDDFGKPIAGPLCESELNTTVYKSGGSIAQFQYFSDTPDTLGKTMSMIITSFNTGIEGKCAPFEFQCANKLCISKDLICNNYNECSDNSDETSAACHSSNPGGSNTGLILGLSIPGTIIIIVVIVVVVLRWRKRSQYEKFKGRVQVSETTKRV